MTDILPDVTKENRRVTSTPLRSHFFDKKAGVTVVKVMPGGHYVTSSPEEVLITILGSCVAACIRDPVRGVGGMNHFIFPGNETSANPVGVRERFGSHAMESLINDILSVGGRRGRLEAKVFGGGNVIRSSFPVGSENAAFVSDYLTREGIVVAATDLGGYSPRRVEYYPVTGRVRRQLLKGSGQTRIFQSEASLRASLADKPIEGSVELFED